MAQMPSKECRKCGESKPRFAFPKNSTQEDGVHYYCRSCHNTNNVEYRADQRKKLFENLLPANRGKKLKGRKT